MKKLVCFIVIAMWMVSCSQDLIQKRDDNSVIEIKNNDVKFKFCLLNNDSVPSTTFQEGENIYFYFAIENISGKTLLIDEKDLFHVFTDFCTIYDRKNEAIMGKPRQSLFCFYRALIIQELSKSEPWVLLLSWNDKPVHNKIKTRYLFFCNYENDNEFLQKGNYSCRFKMDFLYKINDKPKMIDNLACIIHTIK